MISKSLFGTTPEGEKVFNYTLTDEKGQSVVMSEYACAIIEMNVFDKDGKLCDVALGYDTLEEYLSDTRNFGATVGRYANRIKDGKFVLNGVTYHLPRNNGKNTLHGGFHGFGKKIFSSEISGDSVIFKLHSPELDEGFPGNFDLTVKTTFKNGALRFDYEYICDKDTPANITNHNYFNLNGHGKGSILNHSMKINAEKYCKADEGLLALAPTVSVEGTSFDFRNEKKIIEKIFEYSPEIINAKGGFDHCFEIKNPKNFAAVATGDVSGIKLQVSSDMPAMQFYSGNNIGHAKGKNGAVYNNYEGFALECQQFPNAVNEPAFPSAIAKAGQPVSCFIEYKLFV
ncbi:MAG: galactose mutarotase [Synergistaceae bacterium]|nr:galactose mutarotase [Synergistaceae bacterium]